MKKLLFALAISAFLFGCKSDDTENTDTPNDTTTVVLNDETSVENDTTTIVLTDEEVDVKSDEILKKSEDINNKLDDILNN